MKDYSFEELKAECDQLLLNYVKSGNTFSLKEKTEHKTKRVSIGAKKEESYSPYGTLFNNYK